MKLSTVHKQRLSQIGRVTLAGAMVVGSVSTAVVAPVEAGALTTNRTIITDSRPGQSNVGYTIRFTPPASSTTAIAQTTVKFCNAAGSFSGCVAPTGLDVADSVTLDASAKAYGFGNVATETAGTFARVGANEFTFTPDSPAAEGGIEIYFDLAGLVDNPTNPGSYYTMVRTYSDAGTTEIDSGTSAFAIVDKVNVTGRVAEMMTFTVAGVNSGQPCGGTENATVTSEATAVPFGNFVSGTPRVACQTVAVSTNAVTGYQTSIRHTLGGTSPVGGMCRQTATGCGADGSTSASAADVIVDAGLTGSPAAWVNSTTFGIGLNSNGGQTAGGFGGGTTYISMFGAAAKLVAENGGPTAAVTTNVKFKADVPATQTAGVYQNSLEYITTPRF